MMDWNLESGELIDVAMGRKAPSLVIKGGNLINVHTEEIYREDIAVKGERIAYLGDSENIRIDDRTRIIDAEGKYIAPGLIDPHIHLYHTQLNMTEVARALLSRGTTTVAEGFYAIGIVSGIEGIRFFLDEIGRTPLRVVFLTPSLAQYQTTYLGLPKTPNGPSFEEYEQMLDWSECQGIEEPPYTPILKKDRKLLALFETARSRGNVITGHASGLSGGGLNAYLAVGASNDHECGSVAEARTRARLGMRVIMRQGSAATDLSQVVKALTEEGISPRYFSFCADVASTLKIAEKGHIDDCIRIAITHGLNPITAVQAATLNAAEVLKMEDEIGSIAPGKKADILILNDLSNFDIDTVIAAGKPIIEKSEFTVDLHPPEYPELLRNTVDFGREVAPEDFLIKVDGEETRVRVRVIGVQEGALISEELKEEMDVQGGIIGPDIERDILKIAMLDRFHLSGRIGIGLIRGFRLKRGAIATTYAPTTENIIVVGTNDIDMAWAVNRLAEMGGGHVAVHDKQAMAELPLSLCGLLSDQTLETVIEKQEELHEAIKDMGCEFPDPFQQLGFSGVCPEIGSIKISEKGIIDVDKGTLVPLILE